MCFLPKAPCWRPRRRAKKKTQLNLEAPAAVARLRVVAGPRVDDRQADLGDLLRRGAQEQFLRVDPGSLRHELPFVIYPDIWRCWLRSACVVRGNLYKRVLIGGIWRTSRYAMPAWKCMKSIPCGSSCPNCPT
ncbi:MAG: hypothetical protein IPH23_02415 [Gammaproteobacteria bacterium]|nr:hypothetical protein [Gammaproteobacteria bacterium]